MKSEEIRQYVIRSSGVGRDEMLKEIAAQLAEQNNNMILFLDTMKTTIEMLVRIAHPIFIVGGQGIGPADVEAVRKQIESVATSRNTMVMVDKKELAKLIDEAETACYEEDEDTSRCKEEYNHLRGKYGIGG